MPRRLRFKLKTLFTLTTLVALTLAFFANRYSRAWKQHTLVQSLRASGATVRYKWNRHSSVDRSGEWLPGAYLPVANVEAGNTPQFDDDDLDNALALRELEVLELHHTSITDKGLKKIAAAKLPNLRAINLMDTNVSDAGLAHLASIKSLQVVVLSSCQNISDEGVQKFQAKCGPLVRVHR